MTYYVAGIPYSADELYHYGITGMKWGVRKYQLPNGTLTSAGRERYAASIKKSNQNSKMNPETKEKLKKAAKVAAITAGTALAAYGTYKLAKSGVLSDVTNVVRKNGSRSIIDPKGGNDTVKMARNASKLKNTVSKIKDANSAFKMDDKTLLEKIARLEREKKLMDLTYDTIMNPADPTKRTMLSAGKKAAETILAGAGVYGIKVALTQKVNAKDAADYIAPKPKKK